MQEFSCVAERLSFSGKTAAQGGRYEAKGCTQKQEQYTEVLAK
jgi:hypothetical protein